MSIVIYFATNGYAVELPGKRTIGEDKAGIGASVAYLPYPGGSPVRLQVPIGELAELEGDEEKKTRVMEMVGDLLKKGQGELPPYMRGESVGPRYEVVAEQEKLLELLQAEIKDLGPGAVSDGYIRPGPPSPAGLHACSRKVTISRLGESAFVVRDSWTELSAPKKQEDELSKAESNKAKLVGPNREEGFVLALQALFGGGRGGVCKARAHVFTSIPDVIECVATTCGAFEAIDVSDDRGYGLG